MAVSRRGDDLRLCKLSSRAEATGVSEINLEELRNRLQSEIDNQVSIWISLARVEAVGHFGTVEQMHAAMDLWIGFSFCASRERRRGGLILLMLGVRLMLIWNSVQRSWESVGGEKKILGSVRLSQLNLSICQTDTRVLGSVARP